MQVMICKQAASCPTAKMHLHMPVIEYKTTGQQMHILSVAASAVKNKLDDGIQLISDVS